MKISLPYIVCAFCLVGLFACRQGEMELLLTELDHTIENKAVYTERFNGRTDSLRRALRDAGDDTRRWRTGFSTLISPTISIRPPVTSP